MATTTKRNGNGATAQPIGGVKLGANALTAHILEYLTLRGIFAWRNNTGAYKPDKTRFIRFGKKGSGDILGVIPPHGTFLSIEVKAEGDRLRPSQIEWMQSVQGMGGIAMVAHSLEDVESIFGYRSTNGNTKVSAMQPLAEPLERDPLGVGVM